MEKSYDVVIIGAGPAGLTAGVYCSRYGLKTLVVEKYYVGGQMNLSSEIRNYPGFEFISGLDLSEKMKEQYLSCHGDLINGEVKVIDFENKIVYIKNEKVEYKALILAMGASARKLNLENEEKLIGKGVSYCAICDGFFFKGKDVAVIGSGNSALEDANYLADICASVSVVSKHEKFRGQQVFIDSLKNKTNVKYYMGYQPSKIIGEEVLKSIEVKSVADTKTINCEGMFIQIGRLPDSKIVSSKIECSPAGFIKTDESLQTNISGVFAIGDVIDKKLRQIVTACSDGAIAATSVLNYIENNKK
ncbi:MAG: FAD-dependent oxidoreductase [Clostridia bacterium]|nr:FAD-dependent oxidoreductase [Clostridia bacterium]